MDIRRITDDYSVSPQIEPADCAAIAEAGFTCVICNRPDMEIPPALQSNQMRAAAEEAGLTFHELPLTHQTLMQSASTQAELIAGASGPVLAYCASGTRSTMVWALGKSGDMPADEIIAAGGAAGYDLTMLRGALDR